MTLGHIMQYCRKRKTVGPTLLVTNFKVKKTFTADCWFVIQHLSTLNCIIIIQAQNIGFHGHSLTSTLVFPKASVYGCLPQPSLRVYKPAFWASPQAWK